MRQILLFSLLMSASVGLHAQDFSAGFRANAGYWLTPKDEFGYHFEALQGDHMVIVPAVFVRFAAKKKWAFEASLNRSDHNYAEVYTVILDALYDTATEAYKVRNNDLTLSAQYELSSPSLRKSPLFNRIHSYVGITLGIVLVQNETSFYPDYSPNVPTRVYEHDTYEFWTGLSHNMTFNMGKKLMLISGAYFKVRPSVLLSHGPHYGFYNPVARFGGQLGAAYRF